MNDLSNITTNKSIVAADTLISIAEDSNSSLTQLNIHTLLYFSEGFSLGINGKSIVDQEFEAWKYGPILSDVYNEFKNVRNKSDSDTLEGHSNIFSEESPEYVVLKSVYLSYGSYDAKTLVKMTHYKNSPWDYTWNHLKGYCRKGVKIPTQAMQNYFTDQLTAGYNKLNSKYSGEPSDEKLR